MLQCFKKNKANCSWSQTGLHPSAGKPLKRITTRLGEQDFKSLTTTHIVSNLLILRPFTSRDPFMELIRLDCCGEASSPCDPCLILVQPMTPAVPPYSFSWLLFVFFQFHPTVRSSNPAGPPKPGARGHTVCTYVRFYIAAPTSPRC